MRNTFKEKIWELRLKSSLRRLYFVLPVSLRMKIRSAFAKSMLLTGPGKPVAHLLFDQLPTSKLNEKDLQNLEGLTTWKIGSIEFKPVHATYVLHDQFPEKYSHVSFDVWDTIVGRYRPAEGVKRSTSLFMSLSDWKRRDFEGKPLSPIELHDYRNEVESVEVSKYGESSLYTVLSEVISRYRVKVTPEEAYNFEICDEIENSYLIRAIKSHYDESPAKKALISDFHLPGVVLQRILSELGLRLEDTAVHSSFDYLQTKRDNGKLFNSLGYSQIDDWVHIGDNLISDVSNSTKFGAKSIQVSKISINSWHLHELIENSLADDLWNLIGSSAFDRYITDIATIAYSVCTAAIERAWSEKVSKVVYISREGETLALAHANIVKDKFFENLPSVEAIHFPVSRSSIVMASWAGFEEKGLQEIGIQYPYMTADALIETLGLPKELHKLVLKNIAKFERVRTKEAWGLLDTKSQNAISRYLSNQRELVLRYMIENEINPFNSIVCDLGWRGSIQDAMSRIIGHPFYGQYLGLYAPFSKNDLSEKHGLIFDEPRGRKAPEYLNFLGPIERAFTVSSRQVARYEVVKGNVQPVFHLKSELQNPARSKATRESIPHATRSVTRTLLSVGLFGVNASNFSDCVLKNWILEPNEIHAASWFDEEHREGFGAGDEVHYKSTLPNRSWTGKSIKEIVQKNAISSLWIEGYLAWMPVSKLIKKGQKHE
jgi:hypothetical protein